jgi:ascorbate-specific PTS system EIIC-type component UlaA
VRGLGFGSRLGPAGSFLGLGGLFFRVAAFVPGAFSGATCAPCAATAAGLSAVLVSAAVVMCLTIFFCACFVHDNSSLASIEKASGKVVARRGKAVFEHLAIRKV